ncbi:unnamed protein product [Paramecium pentaurelia]|uniref:Uncharacterized protein n=1 Tax=Paramecium pentaurelia TaxID=43138 RepID=A0A8S1YLE7_9CILI|nr:unnamed protein product [Paramecium pentaurelia]
MQKKNQELLPFRNIQLPGESIIKRLNDQNYSKIDQFTFYKFQFGFQIYFILQTNSIIFQKKIRKIKESIAKKKEQDNKQDNPQNGYTDNVHVAKNYQVSREVEVNLLVCKKKKLLPQLQNEDINIKSKQSRIFQVFENIITILEGNQMKIFLIIGMMKKVILWAISSKFMQDNLIEIYQKSGIKYIIYMKNMCNMEKFQRQLLLKESKEGKFQNKFNIIRIRGINDY